LCEARGDIKSLNNINVFGMVADFFGALLLGLYALIIGPLGVLRGPIVFERTLWYLVVMLPQGLLARAVRAAIDWRMGHFDAAITQMEGLVGSHEEYFRDKPASRARRRVLEDLYTVLARAYLHAGHIDDAMLVVIRAKKSLGLERLPGLAELDAKTAHLVRAGLAAGRLLDGGGLATMFVRSAQQKPKEASRPLKDVESGSESANRLGDKQTKSRGSREGADQPPSTSEEGATIIQFPTSYIPDPELRH